MNKKLVIESPQGLQGTAFQKTLPDINIPIGTTREDPYLRKARLHKVVDSGK